MHVFVQPLYHEQGVIQINPLKWRLTGANLEFFFSVVNYFAIAKEIRLPSRLRLQNTLTASLQRGKTPHQTVWRWGSCDAGALGNAENPFIAIAARSILTWSGSAR